MTQEPPEVAFVVSREDDCIWLNDQRESSEHPLSLHVTLTQAKSLANAHTVAVNLPGALKSCRMEFDANVQVLEARVHR